MLLRDTELDSRLPSILSIASVPADVALPFIQSRPIFIFSDHITTYPMSPCCSR